MHGLRSSPPNQDCSPTKQTLIAMRRSLGAMQNRVFERVVDIYNEAIQGVRDELIPVAEQVRQFHQKLATYRNKQGQSDSPLSLEIGGDPSEVPNRIRLIEMEHWLKQAGELIRLLLINPSEIFLAKENH